MNPRLVVFALLALFWLALAIVMAFRLYETWFRQVEDWKRWVIFGLAVAMLLFNLVRIYRLNQRQKQKENVDVPSF